MFSGYFMTPTLIFLIQAMHLQRGMGSLSAFKMETFAFMISLGNSTCLVTKKIPAMVKVGWPSEGLQSGEAYTLLSKCDSPLLKSKHDADGVKCPVCHLPNVRCMKIGLFSTQQPLKKHKLIEGNDLLSEEETLA